MCIQVVGNPHLSSRFHKKWIRLNPNFKIVWSQLIWTTHHLFSRTTHNSATCIGENPSPTEKKISCKKCVYMWWVVLTLQDSFARIELELIQIWIQIIMNGFYWKPSMECNVQELQKKWKTFFMKENAVNHKRVKTCWISTERQQGNGRNEWPQCLIIILCGICLT